MQRSRSKKIKDVFAYILLTVTVFYLLIWAFSPPIIRYFIEPILAQYNLTLGIDSNIRYNPFLTALKIRNLSLEKDDKTSVHFDSLDLEIHLHRLLGKQLYVSKFELDGFEVDINQNSTSGTQQQKSVGGYAVAGFPIGEKDTQDSTNQKETNTEKTSASYELIADKLSVKNSTINAYIAAGHQELKIRSIRIGDIYVSDTKRAAKIEIDFELNDAPGTLGANADLNNGIGMIKVNGSLRDYNLDTLNSLLPREDFKITGTSNIQFESTVDIDGNRINIRSKNILLGGKNVLFENGVIQFTSHAQDINITHLDVNIPRQQKPDVEVNLNIKIDRTRLLSVENQDTIAEWTTLEVDDATFNYQETVETHLNAVKIGGVILSQKKQETAAENIPALVALDGIVLSKITASDDGIDIGNIVLSGLIADILIGTDKNILTLVDVTPRSKKKSIEDTTAKQDVEFPESKKDVTENPDENAYAISLGHVEFVDTQRLFFQDSSVDPKYERTFVINKLEAGPFDNRKPLENSPFLIDGGSDKYAKFNFQGNFKPFTELLNFSMKGKIREISLPSVSSYMKDALGFELKSGQLDTELDISVKESVISGKTRLKVRGIEMSAADGNQADSLQDNKALPLNAALSMLKDRNNNIDLKIPLSGNINNPSFGVSSFIALVVEKAALKQAKSYLLQTFVPYASVVSVVMAAGEQALKVRFNDLVYPKTATEISQQQEVFIQQFVKLMDDKPGTQVKVCGIASLSDIGATGKGSSLKESEKEQLRNIAQQRADNFKTYVLSKSDIKSKRLFLCAPEIDFSDNSEPRIEFST